MSNSVNNRSINDLEELRSNLSSDNILESTFVISNHVSHFLRILVITASLITITVGLLVLSSWILDIGFLKSLHPSYNSMKANTSICFVLLGSAVLFFELFPDRKILTIIKKVFLLIVFVISTISLFEYIFNWNAGIDELLFRDTASNSSNLYPGRLAFSTVICFLLLTFSLIFINSKVRSIIFLSQIFPLAAVLLSLMPVLGYFYGDKELLSLAYYSNIALHTAITLFIISLGILCVNHSSGFLSILSINGPGGYMARRLLPITLLIPVLVVWIRLLTDFYAPGRETFDILLISFLYIGIFAFSIWKIARSIDFIDSDRKITHNALEQSEQRFNIAFHSSPAALTISKLANGIIIDINDAYCMLVGKSREELLGRSTLDLDLWANNSDRDNLIAELRAKGKVHNIEIKLKKGSKEIRTALASFELINLYGGSCILSSALDITDMKFAQETIKAREERYRSTLDNMMEGCQLLSFEWRYLYLNDAAEKHNRRPSNELLGNIYMEMWPGIETTEVFKSIKDCMENRVPNIIKTEFVFPDRTIGWFDLRIQPVPEGVFILSTDITDLKITETQNELANEILEHLNRHTDTEAMITSVIKSIRASTGIEAVAIRIKNGEDYPYFKTSGFSDEFIETEKYLCSYDKDGNAKRDANGNALLECMCGNILCNRVDSSKSFFTAGGSFRSNNTTLLLDSTTDEDRLARTRNRCNSSGYESVALVPLRSGSEIVGLLQLNDHRKNLFDEKIIPFFETLGSSIGIAIMRNKVENEIKDLNVELEKRVEERTEQLMESNKELESFAYSVSHDLRAPLRHVIGFTEILESDLGKMADPEISRLTGTIKNSAHKMGLLIDELLGYSRLGRTKLKTIKIPLNPIIEQVLSEASDIIKERDIVWNISRLPDVEADPTLLSLVFQNLINNSIKFTRKKQKAIIEIDFEDNNSKEYTFFIKDNGAGFDMKYSGKLFGVFQRLHTTEEFEGTGIGLATVKRIIKRHGGSVWASSVKNEGSVFFFTLPK
jgi:PAS domain S-box-containing protein